MDKTIRTVRCPRCGKPAEWSPANPYRPFCSRRCKTTDLGAWAGEDYRVAAAEPDIFSETAPPQAD
ncbi:DNA gyrase inhibitor YacG [Neisseria sp. 23W00296]|uniref:DNA gyrase inhibitor YacG n=1 Tax=unclassified Neisseria TaxID=2623750 RepID=UPI0002A1F447|nr:MULTISPECIES: DNA gyrase inhibitor YacG [unclassified Neisseria]ASP17157.1 DNA gyrase inhibitor YacG [Neisseria sp. KEM232]EKY07848.1 hypothetical protein HMPREF9120_00897 [Neisseria sp. oral taxon 020 str. F0370]